LKALANAIWKNGETVADTKAAQTQKKAIRCIDRKGLLGVFVQTMKPITAPTASTTQRPRVPAPCRGTFIPAKTNVRMSRTKKRCLYFQRQATSTSSANIAPRKETLLKS